MGNKIWDSMRSVKAILIACRMKYVLLFLSSLFPSLLLADNVTVEQAKSLATNFFKSSAQTRSTSTSPQIQLIWNGEDANTRSTGTEPAFYVFNRTDQKGFIIVSGDDITMPVLGYSFKNEFKSEEMPINLKDWLKSVREQINDARKRNVKPSAKTRQIWNNASSSIGTVERQLETAKWNQSSPYDFYCPMVNGRKAVTGCVATALAIVMRYHQWPDKGDGTLPSYQYEVNGIMRTQQGHKLEKAYNWSNMRLNYEEYTNNYNQPGAKDVAQLIYDCGVMSEATYTSKETGAYTQTAVQGLFTYMKYRKDVQLLYRKWYADTEWNRMLKQEIKTNGPVLYAGQSSGGGHQFVLDGYTSNGYFGVNWGWGGSANGYFLVSDLNPYETGIGGGSGGGFNEYQSAVFGLKKADRDSDFAELMMLGPGTNSNTGVTFNGLSSNETAFTPGKYFTVTAGYCWNRGFNHFNGEIILSLVDEEGYLKEDISNTVQLELDSGWGSLRTFNCRISVALSGGDRIWLRYRSENTPEWQRMPNEEGTVSEIIVMDPEAEKSIEESTSFSYSKTDKVIVLKTKHNVTYQLTSPQGSEIQSGKTTSNNLEIRINTGEFTPGTYTLSLQKGSDKKELTFVIGKQQ